MVSFIERFTKEWRKLSPEAKQHEKEIILKSISMHPELRNFFFDFTINEQGKYYGMEANVEREAYRKIIRYTKLLPAELRFIIPRPKYYINLAKSVNQGNELIKALENRFAKQFKYFEEKSYIEFVKQLRKSPDPRVQKALSILDHQQVNLVMHRKRERRDEIRAFGFANQFATGTSGGTFSPEMRDKAEAGRLGISPEEYENYSSYLKAKWITNSVIYFLQMTRSIAFSDGIICI